MRIEFISASQFVVAADNAQERAILHEFVKRIEDDRTVKFCFHGSTFSCDLRSTISFSFGFKQAEEREVFSV